VIQKIQFGENTYGVAQREALIRALAKDGAHVMIKCSCWTKDVEWVCLITKLKYRSIMKKGTSLWDSLSQACEAFLGN